MDLDRLFESIGFLRLIRKLENGALVYLNYRSMFASLRDGLFFTIEKDSGGYDIVLKGSGSTIKLDLYIRVRPGFPENFVEIDIVYNGPNERAARKLIDTLAIRMRRYLVNKSMELTVAPPTPTGIVRESVEEASFAKEEVTVKPVEKEITTITKERKVPEEKISEVKEYVEEYKEYFKDPVKLAMLLLKAELIKRKRVPCSNKIFTELFKELKSVNLSKYKYIYISAKSKDKEVKILSDNNVENIVVHVPPETFLSSTKELEEKICDIFSEEEIIDLKIWGIPE